jgi:Flp pilus assembly protein TadD
MMRGEFDRGLALIREAVRLSPFDLGLNMNLGDFLIFSGRFDESIRQLEHTLAMDERFVPGRLRLAEALALSGHVESALAHAKHALVAAPAQPRVRETHAFVLAASGRRDEARRGLTALAAERDRHYVSAWEIARAYAAMADADAAFLWLGRAIDERAPMTLFAGVHPALDPVRDDPRFAGILRRIGLPPAPAVAAARE